MRNYDEASEVYEDEESEDQESEDFESGEEAEDFESAEELDETEEMELASQLLEINDEAQLDQFIGRLIKRAGRAVGQVAGSGAGRALAGILKGAAKNALPVLGGAIGGPDGSRVGSQLAAKASSLFGLELEGLSEEDQEFEAARRLVRFTDAAAKNLASAAPSASPEQSANTAVIAAAKRHAPGMIRAAGPLAAAAGSEGCPTCGKGAGSNGQPCPKCGKPQSGRWIRRGRHIIIVNAHGAGQFRNKSSA